MNLLELIDVTLSVRSTAGEREILHGVTFAIERAETLALVGESGSGKSMTARCILRLLPLGAELGGRIIFDGVDITGLDAEPLRALRRDRIGMIFQDPRAHVNPVRTIGDFLTEGLKLRGATGSDARRSALAGLDAVRIPHAAQRMKAYPHELSGGMLQRVMIASVLLAEPDLILADEPTTALDVTTQAEVLAILEELRTQRDMAMILITHDLDLAAAVCHRTAVMSEGVIVEQGPSIAIQEAPQHPYTRRLVEDRPMLPAGGSR